MHRVLVRHQLNRLDHLEGRGLVRRRPDPSDARSVRVQITSAGRKRVDGALEDLAERENAILGTLGDTDRAVRRMRHEPEPNGGGCLDSGRAGAQDLEEP